MFQITVSTLTAFSMLWHAVAGCCAHHLHADSQQNLTGTSVACDHHHAGGHLQRHSQSAAHPPDGSCERSADSQQTSVPHPQLPEPCRTADCYWVSVAKVQLPGDHGSGPAFLALSVAAAAALPASHSRLGANRVPAWPPLTSESLRALTRVWQL